MDGGLVTYGDDVLDHGVGGGQAGPQQVRHHVDDLLVQLREPDHQQASFQSISSVQCVGSGSGSGRIRNY